MNLLVFLLQGRVGPSEISNVTRVGEGGRGVYGMPPPLLSQQGTDACWSFLYRAVVRREFTQLPGGTAQGNHPDSSSADH